MLTLSYGFKKPETGDKGGVFFPALEDNAQQVNDHNHNGTNSARLTTLAMTVLTSDVLSASWVAQGDGVYRQLITMPAGLAFDEVAIGFRETVSTNTAHLNVEKVSSNSYYVYANDSTKAFTAIYTS